MTNKNKNIESPALSVDDVSNLSMPSLKTIFVELMVASFYFVLIAGVAIAIHIFIEQIEPYVDWYMLYPMKAVKFYVFAIDIVVYVKFVTVSGLKIWKEIG